MKRVTWGRSVDRLTFRRMKNAGFTPEMFAAALEDQAGLCGVCCKPMHPVNDTHMDHDHVTGKPRGLLCLRCNMMLGYAKDRPEVLTAGAAYLNSCAQ